MQNETEAIREADRPSGEDEAPLVWAIMKPDNLIVKSLKDVVGLYSHIVKKEVQTMEKNILQARKIYGR